MAVDPPVAHALHHSQVLEIIVRLEESVASEELDKNATDTPNIAGEGPSKSKDDLGSTVVTRRHHRRVILVFESSGAKIDEANLGVEEYLALRGLSADASRG